MSFGDIKARFPIAVLCRVTLSRCWILIRQKPWIILANMWRVMQKSLSGQSVWAYSLLLGGSGAFWLLLVKLDISRSACRLIIGFKFILVSSAKLITVNRTLDLLLPKPDSYDKSLTGLATKLLCYQLDVSPHSMPAWLSFLSALRSNHFTTVFLPVMRHPSQRKGQSSVFSYT